MKRDAIRCLAAAVMTLLMAIPFFVNVRRAFGQDQGLEESEKDKAAYAAMEKVPAAARAKPSPLKQNPDARAAGGKLFEQHCAECHGMKAEGTKRAPSLLKEQVQQATPGALFWIVTNGVVRHGMPVWSKLPEQQRWQIVTFLKSFRKPAVDQPARSQ
jgi:mono/diheme cytochrome c family protein